MDNNPCSYAYSDPDSDCIIHAGKTLTHSADTLAGYRRTDRDTGDTDSEALFLLVLCHCRILHYALWRLPLFRASVMWLLANWRITAILTGVLACFYGGWYCHSIVDGYLANNGEKHVVKKLGNGAAAIISFDEAIHKDKSLAKDDCFNKPIPNSALRMLK